MYVDHRTATTVQQRRSAELRSLASRRRSDDRVETGSERRPAPARFSAAWFAALLRPRHA